MPDLITAEQAARLVKNNDVLIVGGNGGTGVPEAILVALEKRFLADAAPRDITLFHVTGIGAVTEQGLCRFAHRGMVARVIGGNFGLQIPFTRLAVVLAVVFVAGPFYVRTAIAAFEGVDPGERAHVFDIVLKRMQVLEPGHLGKCGDGGDLVQFRESVYQGSLAGPDFTRQEDEPLVFEDAVSQNRQPLLVLFAQPQKGGVWLDAEGASIKAEVLMVHGGCL